MCKENCFIDQLVIKLIPFIIIIIVIIIIIIIIIVIVIIIILRKKHSSDYYFMLVIYNKPCLPCIRVLVCTRRLYSPYFTECFPDTINWKNYYYFFVDHIVNLLSFITLLPRDDSRQLTLHCWCGL